MPRIIPVFMKNRGCPHRCIFCHPGMTGDGKHEAVSRESMAQTVAEYLCGGKAGKAQIAFYGGNFTGLPAAEQREMLRLAAFHIEQGEVAGIRVSTRPDAIDAEIVHLLKENHVQTVEIGAQSLIDEVLIASGRGHSADDVAKAVRMLQAAGLEVGLHLMIGLPGDSRVAFERSVEAVVALAPDMVRIHPTLVFRDTLLAEYFYRGTYMPLTMREALDSCKYAVQRFASAEIPVIRLGLQTTREMEQPGAVVAGPFHPAFGALVESAVFLDQASAMLRRQDVKKKRVTFCVPPQKESAFRGQRNENLHILTERFDLSGIHVRKGASFEIVL